MTRHKIRSMIRARIPLDTHGDSPALATRIFVDQEATRGQVGLDPADLDVFRFELEAGQTYTVELHSGIGGAPGRHSVCWIVTAQRASTVDSFRTCDPRGL